MVPHDSTAVITKLTCTHVYIHCQPLYECSEFSIVWEMVYMFIVVFGRGQDAACWLQCCICCPTRLAVTR